MKRQRVIPLLLAALLLAAALGSAQAAQTPERMVVTFAAEEGEALLAQLEAREDVEVLYRYERLLSGAAVECTAAAAAELAALPGVEAVLPAGSYSLPQTVSQPLLESNSLPLMGGGDLGWNGDGMVIAVLDSGLRYTHEAFQDSGLAQSPAISREAVADFVQAGGTPGRYLSARIPFAYDYAAGDSEVLTADTHGTHVSALAVGYVRESDGAVKFRGVAPAAQLLSMKVFADNADAGANDADILKALEDAAALGADVICLSLGSDSGFCQDTALDGLYSGVFARLREQGIVICCAAGNGASALSAKTEGAALPTGDYTDYGTIAAPASYPGTVAVAAATADRWQSTGYLQAGQRQLACTAASSESGLALPGAETLGERSLELVYVGGVGAAEDYAGVDAAGRAVLVARGTITFTEKVRAAAEAGAALCILYNNEPGSITPIVECDQIPCVLLSQEDGAWLLESGISAVTLSGRDYVAQGESAMLAQSAWGTTSDLRIAPTLTAPGGTILSASAGGDGLYEQLSGTSMAAPNAAGAYALVLEKLREEGLTGGEAADLADALLCGSAQLMTDGEGVPLSPRRQGAGLIDLSAALGAETVVLDPLLELGESAGGQFTLRVRLRNLGEEPRELAVTAVVLTDDWTVEGEQAYSLLAPLALTDRVTLSGPDTVTVPGGGETTLTLTLTIPSALRQELLAVYPNGFFTEGYLLFTDSGGTSVHATFLGYCGDWEAASVVEPRDFRDVMDAQQAGETLQGVNMGASLVYIAPSTYAPDDAPLLGQGSGGAAPWREERFAISSASSDALYRSGVLLTTELYTLRNARRLILVVFDSGGIHRVADIPYLTRSGWNELTGQMGSACTFWWDGTDSHGQPLPDGSRVQVRCYAWPESDAAMTAAYDRSGCSPEDPDSYRWLVGGGYDRCLEWSFPVTIDRAAPVVSAQAGESGVDITVEDEQYLDYVSVKDSKGIVLVQESYGDDRAGQSHTLSVPLTGGETLYVTAVDYAGNTAAYAVDTAALAAEPCAMALLEDVDLAAWYHEAVDRVWSMGILREKEPLAFHPDELATRADLICTLYQLAGSPEPEGAALPFTDVNSSADCRQALQWAWEQGLVTGYSDRVFAAFAGVSRQQLAQVLYRWAGQLGETAAAAPEALARFSDADQAADWAEEALGWAVETGLLTGDGDTLAPQRAATRAELAQVLANFLESREAPLGAGA